MLGRFIGQLCAETLNLLRQRRDEPEIIMFGIHRNLGMSSLGLDNLFLALLDSGRGTFRPTNDSRPDVAFDLDLVGGDWKLVLLVGEDRVASDSHLEFFLL